MNNLWPLVHTVSEKLLFTFLVHLFLLGCHLFHIDLKDLLYIFGKSFGSYMYLKKLLDFSSLNKDFSHKKYKILI